MNIASDILKRTVNISEVHVGPAVRYVLCDTSTNSVIEHAQHFGFTTPDKANNFALSHGWDVTNPPCINKIYSLF